MSATTELHRARLNWVDPYTGETHMRLFRAPADGGYVKDQYGGQVCRGLTDRGVTLLWHPDMGPLQNMINRERGGGC